MYSIHHSKAPPHAMILLLGASGYFGQAFAAELTRRGRPFAALSRREADYTRFDVLLGLLEKTGATFVINAAGFTGKPNVDACETARADTLQGNTLFPLTLAHACLVAKIPWGHISSGCLYAGAKIVDGGQTRIEKDLTRPELQELIRCNPGAIHGFNEEDEPNFSFRNPPCSFYSGSKALGEEAIRSLGEVYVWRPRIPFDEWDNPRNYLSKLQQYPKLYDNVNSISHRMDFARACLDLHERRAAFGIYNVTNPGWITTRHVARMIQEHLKPGRTFDFWESDEEFYRVAAKTPRSNCVLDVSKLARAGVRMRPVEEALLEALENWQSSKG
jgi:dTDP-4-dehydrorhamnose reductase